MKSITGREEETAMTGRTARGVWVLGVFAQAVGSEGRSGWKDGWVGVRLRVCASRRLPCSYRLKRENEGFYRSRRRGQGDR